MNLRVKLTLLLAILFVFAVGNIVLIITFDNYSEENIGWLTHSHQVSRETDKLLSAIAKAESGQRGYLLTEDIDDLNPYIRGLSVAKQSFNNLYYMPSDSPLFHGNLGRINRLMTLRFSELKKEIALLKEGDNQAIFALIKTHNSNQTMALLRDEIEVFAQSESLLLTIKGNAYRERRGKIIALIFVEFILFVVLGLVTLLYLRERLFLPLNLLLENTKKMEKGTKQNLVDILPKDELGHLLFRFYQVSEKINANTEALTYEATHDTLTGLGNRVGLNAHIRAGIMAADHNQNKMAVLFIDLNRFKQLNDSLGHDTGDAVLIETAARFIKSLRSDDFTFRVGGDEFVIILNNMTDKLHIENVVINVLEEFNVPFVFKKSSIAISLSIGIAIAPDNSTDNDNILKYADVAMYAAKNNAQRSYCFFNKRMLKRGSDG